MMISIGKNRLFRCCQPFNLFRYSFWPNHSESRHISSFSFAFSRPFVVSTPHSSKLIFYDYFRRFTSSAKLRDVQKSVGPKRGPKFRTPSKIRDASAAIAKNYVFDDEARFDWNIWAYATADEYKMDALGRHLKKEENYEVKLVANDLPDVFRLISRLGNDRKEIFVFSGAVVFWDVPESERLAFLRSLQLFEIKPYDMSLIEEECERLFYVFHNFENGPNKDEASDADFTPGIKRAFFKKEVLHLDAAGKDTEAHLLERYTVSNVMSASVQLSMWESDFENLANALDNVADAMNKGKIALQRKLAISYAGRLTSLRHNVNLHSDLLDHPDFYWDRVGLEKLYDQASEILCIRRRVRVFNKKLEDAMELVQIIMQELAVRHSARLEWLIIYLICIEVLFDAYHCWRSW